MTTATWIIAGVTILNFTIFLITRLNDIPHLKSDVTESKKDIDGLGIRLNKTENRITAVETRCEDRREILNRLEKKSNGRKL